jgi:hypothetical protein
VSTSHKRLSATSNADALLLFSGLLSAAALSAASKLLRRPEEEEDDAEEAREDLTGSPSDVRRGTWTHVRNTKKKRRGKTSVQ